MSFARLTVNFRSRIQAWVGGTKSSHRRRAESLCLVAAHVEKLESRELLTVTYQGGTLLAHVEAQAVYLGSDWTNTPALQTQQTQLDQFVSSVVNSSYMDMLSNAGYDVGRGTAKVGVVDNIALSKTTAITDAQIQGQIQTLINSDSLQAPDANRLFIAYVEPGVVVQYGGGASNTTFLAYHGAFAGKTAGGAAADIHYAVISYPGAPNFTAAAAGFTSDLNELTAVTSHELAGSVTDPNVNYKASGWFDTQAGKELTELSVGDYAMLNGYQVSDVVNQQDVVITPFTVQTPPPSGLVAPAVTGTALSATSAQLSWKAAVGVEGYRVFEVHGSQLQLLATVPSRTLSYTVNGLPASSTASFEIEPYRGTASVDSLSVSVATPAAAKLPAPQVTAMALNSTIAFLSWNPVAGATAYRIYYSVGTGSPQLLGVVNSKSALGGKFYSTVSGLVPGSTVRFMIEAFNTSQASDSAWISLKLPPS
jgi:hypothetical protein